VHALPTGKKWYDTISSIPELQKECDAISCSTRKLREFPHDVIDIVSRVRHLVENERPTKRTRLDEDTDNVSTRLSSLEYHFLFLFDHSCGHDRARHDALNVNNMNTGYGGKQTRMHDTVIQCEQGYLGPFVQQLKVGDTQSMVWLDGDAGPYWMSAEERESNRKDHYGTKTRTRDFTKDVLIRKLAEKGVEAKGNSKQVQAMCVAHNIPTKYTETEVKEGWEGKAWSKFCGREDGLMEIGRARITASLGQRTQWD
jgi:hypothetical protein